MSLIVYTKAAAQSTGDFEQLCERCCWPTLNQNGQVHALVYPEKALAARSWRPGQNWMPRNASVFRAENGSIGCDSDYADLKIVAQEIYKALEGQQTTLPRPTAAFCQEYALTRHQKKLEAEGFVSNLVRDVSTGEWCLDVEVPETEQSLEVSLS